MTNKSENEIQSCCGGRVCGGIPTTQVHAKDHHDPSDVVTDDFPQQEDFQRLIDRSNNNNTTPFEYAGNHLRTIDFPLGGFGAGNVVLAGDGTLQHWTVVNQTQQNGDWRQNAMTSCFFGIQCHNVNNNNNNEGNNESSSYATILRTKENSSDSAAKSSLPTIPSFRLKGQYPIADLDYDVDCKIQVSLEAMNPLIPSDVKHSSLPCAIFTFSLQNPTDEPYQVRMLASQQNFIGWDGIAPLPSNLSTDISDNQTSTPYWGGNVNTPFVITTKEDDNVLLQEGLQMSSERLAKTDSSYGTLTLSAIHLEQEPNGDVVAEPLSSKSNVSLVVNGKDETDLWQQFSQGKDVPVDQATPSDPSATGYSTCCGVVQTVQMLPNSECTLSYILTWHFPNRTLSNSINARHWDDVLPFMLGNYYSTEWFSQDAQQVSRYVGEKLKYLQTTTRLYRDVLYNSTIPPELLDAAAGRVSTMRSPTMFYTAQGIVLGTEGNGCCPLNCTHVYGYTTLMERLFPALARNMRISDFVRNYDEGCTMRFGKLGWAIDGALACIIKTYLVVQQSDPNCTFLSKVWPNVKDQLERIQTKFDKFNDGVLLGAQFNTYDTSMEGANTFIGSYYITALKAVAEMATLMGDPQLAQKCRLRAQHATLNYQAICWKDSFGYFIADVNESNCKNSYGPGCFVDQISAIGLSSACGFGHIFDPKRESSALCSVLKYNKVTKPPFQDLQKHFYNGDSGITVCSYPNGKLGDGMMYTTLVSSGFTSPMIAGLLLNGKTAAACEIASMIRQRQDGRNASPWNEPECGMHYSRAMAHWNIFDQACGFEYTSCNGGAVSFSPRFNASYFSCFVILDGGWGEYRQEGAAGKESCCQDALVLSCGTASLKCLFGTFQLSQWKIKTTAKIVVATLNGQKIAVSSFEFGVVKFASVAKISRGSSLVLKLSAEDGHHDIVASVSVEKPWQRSYLRYLLAYSMVILVGYMYWSHVFNLVDP